jgi:hypothetical protein
LRLLLLRLADSMLVIDDWGFVVHVVQPFDHSVAARSAPRVRCNVGAILAIVPANLNVAMRPLNGRLRYPKRRRCWGQATHGASELFVPATPR